MVELGNETRQLTEKEMFKLYKMQIQRSQFLEYLLRQVATVTYRYNCFEMSPQLAEFAQVSTFSRNGSHFRLNFFRSQP
jgi:hypothetical protein